MKDSKSNAKRLQMIKERMAERPSSELKGILTKRDLDEWSEDAFLAIEELLQEREKGLANEPEQQPETSQMQQAAPPNSQDSETGRDAVAGPRESQSSPPKSPRSPGAAAANLFVAAPLSIGILSHIFNPTGGGLIAGLLAVVGGILALSKAHGAAVGICVLLLLICGTTFLLSLVQVAGDTGVGAGFLFGFIWMFVMRGGAACLLVIGALRCLRLEPVADPS